MADQEVESTQFLQSQLEKPGTDSKKWQMTRFGLCGVGFFFVVGMGCLLLRPSLAGSVTNMVQIGIASWSSIVAVYLGAQATVDFKSTAAIQAATETK